MYWTRPANSDRRLTAKGVLAVFVLLMLLLALGVKLWYEAVTDPSHWFTVVEELPIPESWTVLGTDTSRGGDFGASPSATRYYLVDMNAVDIAVALEAVVTSIDFEIDDRWDNDCPRYPTTCTVAAVRDVDHLWITIYDRGVGADIELGDERTVTRVPDRAVVRIIAKERR